MMNFECGHIIPESKGGETNEDNLIPICGLCNKSMGTRNMYEYTKEIFPHSYNTLKQKKYSNNTNKNKTFLTNFFA